MNILGFDYKIIHTNYKKEIIYTSDWLSNQFSDDGFEHIFDAFFRNGLQPDSFAVGLGITSSPIQSDSYTDLNKLTGDGYEEQTLNRNNTDFPLLEIDNNDIQISSKKVTFTNTNVNVGNPAFAWNSIVYIFLIANTDGDKIFISWKALPNSKKVLPGDDFNVIIQQKGRQS